MTEEQLKNHRKFKRFDLLLVLIWALSVHIRSLWIWFDWETVRFFVIPRPGRFRILEPWWGNWIDLSDYDIVVASKTFRPVISWLFQAQAFLFGNTVWLYHISNLLVHLLCIWMLYLFLRRVGFSHVMRIMVVLFFAVHPLVTQPFWILGDTAEQYVLLGGLIALLFYNRRTILAMLGIIIAFLSKETAVTVPLWLLLYDLFFIIEKFPTISDIKSLICRQWPFWMVWVFYLIYRTWIFRGIGGYHSINELGLSDVFGVFNQNFAWVLTVAKGNHITAIFAVLFLVTFFLPGIHRSVRFSVIWMIFFLLPLNNLCNKWYLYTPMAIFSIYLIGLLKPLFNNKTPRKFAIYLCLIFSVFLSILSIAELNHQKRSAAIAPEIAEKTMKLINPKDLPHKIVYHWCHSFPFKRLGGHWVDYNSYKLKSEKTPLEATVWDLNATRYLQDGSPVWNRSVQAALRVKYSAYQGLNVEFKRSSEFQSTDPNALKLGYSASKIFRSGTFPCVSP